MKFSSIFLAKNEKEWGKRMREKKKEGKIQQKKKIDKIEIFNRPVQYDYSMDDFSFNFYALANIFIISLFC